MITEAYIAGSINKALFKNNDEYFILHKSDDDSYFLKAFSNWDLNSFKLSNPEIYHYKNIEWQVEQLQEELGKQSEMFDALNLFLTGMDKSLSKELRKESMELLLESLFKNEEVETFVKNRTFATITPDGFDPLSASQLANDIGNKQLSQWYRDIYNAKDIIIAVRNASLITIAGLRNLDELNINILDKEFTDRSIFADFVLAILGKNFNSLGTIIIKHSDSVKNLRIGNPGVFLTNLKDLVYKNLEINETALSPQEIDEMKEIDTEYTEIKYNDFISIFNYLIDNFTGKSKRKKGKRKRFKRLKDNLLGKKGFEDNAIIERVSWIKDRIFNGYIDETQEAILQLIEFQDENSDAEHLCKSLCDIAKSFQETYQIEYSDLLAQKATELNSKDHVPYCIMAENLRRNGDPKSALDFYNEIIDRFPDDVVASCGKAETLRQIGKLSEALALYDDIINKFPQDVVARNGKAETLRQMGKLSEALDLYNEIIDRFPDDVVAISGKAETLRQMGKLSEALALYDDIISKFPEDVVARTSKAETLRQMGKLQEALTIYDQTIKKFPYNKFSKIARYVLLIQIGKNLNEIENEIVILNPQTHDDWVLNHIHCMLLIKLNKIDDAIDKLKRGVESVKNIEELNYYKSALSYAYIKRGRFKEATEELKKEVSYQPVFEVLKTHAYAGDSDVSQSKNHFVYIYKSEIKQINNVAKYLSDRYSLNGKRFFPYMSIPELDNNIIDLEFELITNLPTSFSYSLVT